ncbi:hypothetical protein [Erwinia phage FBB1]|nr:hypothetical protein [Erwinia phage FBB1]
MILTIVFILYYLPTFIAIIRGHSSTFAILIVNIFLGSTIIGYIIALIWALTNPGKSKW